METGWPARLGAHQEAVEEEFIGWEKEVRVIGEVREGCLIEAVWHRWKGKVLAAAAEKGIDLLMLGRWPVGSYEEQGREERRKEERRGEEEGILKQLWDNYRRVRMGAKRKIRKEKKELRKRTMRMIREQGGTSCKLFWTDLRGKRKGKRLNRMNDRRIVEGEEEDEVLAVLEVLAKHWEELGRRSKNCSEDDVVPDTVMGDVGGCELGMCREVSWEEVVES